MSETIETNISQEKSPQAFENLEKLREAGDVGEYFAGLYEEVLEREPALANIIIIPSDKETNSWLEGTGGAFLPSIAPSNESGHGELHMNTGDGWGHYAKLIEERPGGVGMVADKLGVKPEEVTPELLAGFIFLHELGHGKWYAERPSLDWETDGDMRVRDIYSLPALVHGDTTPDDIAIKLMPNNIVAFMASDEGKQYFDDNKAEFVKGGMLSPADVAHAQDAAYHNLPFETYADDFAVKVLRTREKNQGTDLATG